LYLILLGPPGSGKGTQAKVLADRYRWLHLSTGDMLREAVKAENMLGRAAKAYMDKGALVPDDLVIRMLVDRISRPDARNGFILDGFPRTLGQATALDEALGAEGKSIDMALNIAVPDEELIRRLGQRWLCPNCGAIYNEGPGREKEAGKCDNCGGQLYQRADDRPETAIARLEQQKPPWEMLAHYRRQGKLIDIDGTQSVKDVTTDLLHAIERVGVTR